MDPLFLTLDEVQEMHEQQIEFYGGSHGVRDLPALDLPPEVLSGLLGIKDFQDETYHAGKGSG